MTSGDQESVEPRDSGTNLREFFAPAPGAQRRWTIRVDARLLDGRNRLALPSDVARALHCHSGQQINVSVANPAGCASMTVEHQSSPDRTVISGLSDALWRLSVLPGELIDIAITAEREFAIQKAETRLSDSSKRPSAGASQPFARCASVTFSRPEDVVPPRNDRPQPTATRQSRTDRSRLDSEAHADSATPSPATPVSRRSAPAGWGRAPTPLLPNWYFETHGGELLPPDLTATYPAAQRVKDLRDFWSHYSGRLDRRASWSLRDAARQLTPPTDLRVLPTGFGLDTLTQLSLLNRTRNCVQRALEQEKLTNGTVGELMKLPNFGITSLLDLMICLETNVTLTAESTNTDMAATGEQVPSVDEPNVSRTIPDFDLASGPIDLVAAAAREFRGATSVGDLLRLDLTDLVEAAEATSALDKTHLGTSGASLAARVVEAVQVCLDGMSDTKRRVALERTVADLPKTLEALATSAGLSRERMRQLDRGARVDLEAAAGSILGVLAHIASERLGPVTMQSEIQKQTAELLQPRDTPMTAPLAATLTMLRSRLEYTCNNDLCLNGRAAETARTLKAAAKEVADEVGLISDADVEAALGLEWRGHSDELVRWLGWVRLSGCIALRPTARARVKAALIKISTPATKAELATESGLTERQVAGALSNIESVARADKLRWGLREWIDDVYEGIPAEIIQRIEEDGGSTPLNRVLDELPRKFGVSENSVRAYMATPKFVLQDGRIRLRHQHEEYHYQRSAVRDAPGVFALGDGVVGLLYEVDREVTRGSGRQLSPAAGALLGLSVNERLRFDGPHGTSVTVAFSGTSLTGPSLGSTRGLAEAANAKIGDTLTVILHRGEMTVSAQATDLDEHDAGWALVTRLTGVSENAGMDGLAAALHCSRGEVRATLRARRDTAVLYALPERRSTPDLEEALAALDAEMQREERP